MRKSVLFLSLILVLSLVLAACGGAKEENQENQTTPLVGATELPNTGLQGTETTGGLTATETTGLTGTETTSGLTATETPMALETSAPTVSTTQAPSISATQSTSGLVTGTQTAVLPPTGMADPSRLTTLMTFDVRNANGDVLGDVNNMIIDLGSNRILHVLVGSGGFLGIGEKQIPVPYGQLQVNPACLTALTGTSGTAGTMGAGTSGTGSVTGTETAGAGTSGTGSTGSVTGTETAGTAGTGTTAQAGMDNCYFLLNVDANVLKNAPNFDRNQMPDINTSGWDAQFNDYWQQNGASGTSSTGTSTSDTGSTSGSSTSGSSTSGTGSAAATETPSAGTGSTSGTGTSGTGSTTARANNRLILADELLGMNVVVGNATSSTGGTSSSGTGTSGKGTTTSTETAGAGATNTETAGTGATSTETAGAGASGSAALGETLGTITDAIVDLQSGIIRYFIVTGDTAMGAANGRLVPVPPQAFSFAAAGSSSNPNAVTLNVNNMVLSQAPAFDEGTFPNATIQGWDAGLSGFWSNQGFNSMTNP